MKTLESLFLEELADIFNAELQLLQTLPRMAKAATDGKLRDVFEAHVAESEGHLRKVEKVFGAFYRPIRRRTCEAMEGMIKEIDRIIREHENEPTINAALISGAQKAEHYEMASYGCLHEWARELGNQAAAALLEEILREERATDRLLSDLARNRCNDEADGSGAADENWDGSENADHSTVGAAQSRGK